MSPVNSSTDWVRNFIRRNGAWIGLFVLVAAITILTSGGFLAPRNLTNLLRQTAINGILAAGMTMVILTGGIDLSIGSIVALAGVVAGVAQVHWGWGESAVLGAHFGAFATLALATFAGLVLGVINGGLIAWLGIPPFVITLGMMVIARGVALILSEGSGISPMSDSLRYLGEGYLEEQSTWIVLILFFVGFIWNQKKNLIDAVFPILTFGSLAYAFISYKGFPVPVLFLLGALALTGFILYRMALGRSIYAIGSNEQAALWAGVPVRKVKWFVYSILGIFSGLSGVLLTARLNSAVPTAGNLFELDAIASVVIGGTSLKGGAGTVMGSFVGALTIASLNNGMDLLQVPSFYQMVLKGVIIIVAVTLDRGQKSK
jgi:D-xylose transport system permease protein